MELTEDAVLTDDDDKDNYYDEQYIKLKQSVQELDKNQRVKPATRNEVGSQVSEFHLGTTQDLINVDELASALKAKEKQATIKRALKRVLPQVLPKPLEKPVAEQIKRKIGFLQVKQDLTKWEAVVAQNRASNSLTFPLRDNEPNIVEYVDSLDHFKSPLELEMEKLRKEFFKIKTKENDKSNPEDEEFKLNLEEMMERRKEMAAMRARKSYNDAKLARQSKIKSKKYRRILKKAKTKKQLQDFEALKKSDPEAALKKLEELDRARAEERASLRHKTTGKWAKNRAIRAKYDQESRKELAEQLAVSRELMTKAKKDESSDEEDGVELLKDALNIAEENPWSLEVSSEVNEFISGFRQFWDNKKKTNSDKQQNKNEREKEEAKDIKKIDGKETLNHSGAHLKKRKEKGTSVGKTTVRESLKIQKPESSCISNASGKWEVSDVVDTPSKIVELDIDDAFLQVEEKLSQKLNTKFPVLSNVLKPKKKKSKTNVANNMEVASLRQSATKVKIDEELVDTAREPEKQSVYMLNHSSSKFSIDSNKEDINPQNFLKIKPIHLKIDVPQDEIDGDEAKDDNDDEEHQKMILEAFADDAVTADFQNEKRNEEKTTELEEVAKLPGWGTWAGAGIVPSKRKKKRPYVPEEKLPKRKDEGKPDIIINEEPNPNVLGHLVKDVPFPFKSVEAFEANIRSPISRDWLPESSVRTLTMPEVRTLSGAVIAPMNSNILINHKKRRTHYKGKEKKEKTRS